MNIPHFYPIIDAAFLSNAGIDPIGFARTIAVARAGIAQYRHKGEFTREKFHEAAEVGKILRSAGVTFIVNDRADIALMLGADGVHIGQDDLPPPAVRRIAGERLLIGYSTHNAQQFLTAANEPVDYVALGPVFPTSSKQNPDPVVGTAELARIRALSSKPLVAIGGISRINARQAWEAGADSVAVISDLIHPDPATAIAEWVSLGGD